MRIKISAALMLTAALLLGACASMGKPDRMTQLRTELAKWENFSAEGVVQATHKGFALRRLFSMQKTALEMRLDVLGGGVFGVTPEPLISAYAGPYLAVHSPLLPELESLALQEFKVGGLFTALSNADSLITQYGPQIIGQRQIILQGTELHFSEKLRLERIVDQQSGAMISVYYTNRGDPDRVTLSLDEDTALELFVDRISYGDAQVQALPRNEQTSPLDGLLDMLEELIPAEGD